jgi:hypothetical protein
MCVLRGVGDDEDDITVKYVCIAASWLLYVSVETRCGNTF